jgi:hypothetical protein
MTVEEIRENLLKVLTSTVMNQSTVRNNSTPFQNDRMGHHFAVEKLSAQVTAVKVCCRAAGISEETIRDIMSVCAI